MAVRRFSAVGRLVAAIGVVAGLIAVTSDAAGAIYPTWTLTGANPSWSGTMNVPAPGFPAATFSTDSNTPAVASGGSTWLGPSTPFGAEFGSSQNSPYLYVRQAQDSSPSTTTFTFASPTPTEDWGFALGDVDADGVTIAATGPGGPLTAADLGWQSGFNYCSTTPAPSSCDAEADTDVPTWDPTTSTLLGNVADTEGAAGWFKPTVPITSLTFTFVRQAGFPIYQIWFAALPVVPEPPTPTGPDEPDEPDVPVSPTTTPATMAPAPAADEVPATTAAPAPTQPAARHLPATGAAADAQVPVGVALVVGGTGLVVLARRLRGPDGRHLRRMR